MKLKYFQSKNLFLYLIVFSFATNFLIDSFIRGESDTYASDEREDTLVIDADYTFEEALQGITIPVSVRNKLELLTVYYFSFDGLLHQGQIVVNKKIAADVKEIFEFIEKIKFPIEKVIPMVKYNWSDEMAMEDNNTSCFNYRFVSGTKILSMHANGLAIDINPRQNPYIKHNTNSPAGSSYRSGVTGTIEPHSDLVKEFKKRGWIWGGDWRSLKDYQHFEKRLK